MTPLRVGLDITPALLGRTGVARYVNQFWACLLERDDVEIRAFGAGRGGEPQHPARRLRVPLRVLHSAWGAFGWPKAEHLVGPIDVFHCIDLVPAPTDRPCVVTVHDVLSLTHPELCAPRSVQLQLRLLEAAKRADVVVTTAETTADLVAERLRIPRKRVVATRVGGRRSPSSAPVAVGEPVDTFILAVGEVTPRKGYETLAAAVAQLPKCPPVRIAGPIGWRGEEVMSAVRQHDTRGLISFLGPLADDRLDELYRSAQLVCHPSLAEGFGIGCLEAMEYGVPLVASDIPPTREVVGEAGVLFPPGDVEALAAAISGLADPESLVRFSRAGLDRARGFSWETATERLMEAYWQAAA